MSDWINLPEERIIWAEGGLAERVRELETQVRGPENPEAPGGSGASPGAVAPPGAPTSLAITDQTVIQDGHGQIWVEVEISWAGAADVFEVAIARVVIT